MHDLLSPVLFLVTLTPRPLFRRLDHVLVRVVLLRCPHHYGVLLLVHFYVVNNGTASIRHLTCLCGYVCWGAATADAIEL